MSSNNKSRIAKNTLMLYFRMLFIMAASLYMSRIVLNTLGVDDFGIYNVVAGVIIMLAFLNNSMSGATSRFLTFAIGKGNHSEVKRVFCSAMTIHIAIAIVLLVVAETLGVWFFEHKLVIPANRLFAARMVFQISILSSVFTIVQVPYNALIIAHERMDIFAYTGITEALLKLAIAFSIQIIPFDHLITYSSFLAITTFSIFSFYKIYCNRKFQESEFQPNFNKHELIPMLSFSGWDLYGNLSVIARTQGVNILMNMFFGPAINAANAISVQVQNATAGFAENFLTAIRPQIVKNYAANSIDEMESLMLNASKYSFLLLYLISLPLIVECEPVLRLWLKSPPQFATTFCQLVLINNLVSILFRPFMYAIHATGKMRGISLVNGTIYLLVIPISYVLLRLNFSPIYPFAINILLLLVGSLINVWRVKQSIPAFSVGKYVSKVLARIVAFLIPTIATAVLVHRFEIRNLWLQLASTTTASTVATGIFGYMLVLEKLDRQAILLRIRNKVSR